MYVLSCAHVYRGARSRRYQEGSTGLPRRYRLQYVYGRYLCFFLKLHALAASRHVPRSKARLQSLDQSGSLHGRCHRFTVPTALCPCTGAYEVPVRDAVRQYLPNLACLISGVLCEIRQPALDHSSLRFVPSTTYLARPPSSARGGAVVANVLCINGAQRLNRRVTVTLPQARKRAASAACWPG